MKVAIIVHLFYADLWPEIRQAIANVLAVHPDSDLYVSLSDVRPDHRTRREILREFPDARVEFFPNRGMDVGPFLLWLQQIELEGTEYDAVLKLHGKKCLGSVGEHRGEWWRRRLIESVAGSPEVVRKCTDLLAVPGNLLIGDAGSITSGVADSGASVEEVRHLLGIDEGEHFIAGTIFWVRMDLLRLYFPYPILGSLYRRMPDGYSADGTVAHAVERAFGYVVEHAGGRIVPV